ncbi:hypothetical protein DFH08DRAFT_906688 [Mycena albidolilacea]|uniref:Uncharacterized protein n=1 Tax=Mycena albidolilacea TaxID=1033008 RepID=A0AAD6YY81_9AGAR|nr:hypothetical protein DFH08DRAFT_906688 [Mycena albidolilacea]
MSRRERPTDAQHTPPQLVEKPKDKTTPRPGPKQRARARPGARQRRIEQRTPYTRLGPVSPPAGYCARTSRLVPLRSLECRVACGERRAYPIFMSALALAPASSSYFPSCTHPSHPAPTRLGNLYLPPSPLAPAGVRRSARGSWGVGSRPSWVSVRQSEPQSGVWARSLLPPTLLLHARLSLEVRRVPGSRRRGSHCSSSLVRIRPPMAKTH